MRCTRNNFYWKERIILVDWAMPEENGKCIWSSCYELVAFPFPPFTHVSCIFNGESVHHQFASSKRELIRIFVWLVRHLVCKIKSNFQLFWIFRSFELLSSLSRYLHARNQIFVAASKKKIVYWPTQYPAMSCTLWRRSSKLCTFSLIWWGRRSCESQTGRHSPWFFHAYHEEKKAQLSAVNLFVLHIFHNSANMHSNALIPFHIVDDAIEVNLDCIRPEKKIRWITYGSVLILPSFAFAIIFRSNWMISQRRTQSIDILQFEWSDGGAGLEMKQNLLSKIHFSIEKRLSVSVSDSTQMNEYYLHICINNWILLRIDWCSTLRTHAHTSASVAKGYIASTSTTYASQILNEFTSMFSNWIEWIPKSFFFRCENAGVIWIVSRWHTKPNERKVKMDSNVKAVKLMSPEQTAVTSRKCRNWPKIGSGAD